MNVTERDNDTTQTAGPEGVKRGLERISRWLNLVAVGALLLMFFVMVADILSSKIFNRPITFAVDVASLLALVVASFSVSRTILAGRHIEVEFIVAIFPRGVRRIFNTIASFLSLAFFLLIVWRSIVYANSLLKTGESSLTTHIPTAPFAYGIAVACIPAVLIYVFQTYRDTKEVR
jgi:TRAP-type transport system small permease protein